MCAGTGAQASKLKISGLAPVEGVYHGRGKVGFITAVEADLTFDRPVGQKARVTVDTTVQPKAISFPTDAKLLHAAIKGLNRLARRHGVRLRQSYLRIAKRAAMMAGRYAHAKQFNRHRRQLRLLRTRLGRIIRDIHRKIADQATLESVFEWPLARATQIRSQQQRQRGWKLYSFHAPEVECIGKGKAAAPYEFGVKVSIATTNARAPGGQFVLHAKALPGNPYDGHTLRSAIEDTERLTGRAIERAYVDKGYRGHNASNPHRISSPGRSAACSAPSDANCAAAPPSSTSFVHHKPFLPVDAEEPLVVHDKALPAQEDEKAPVAEPPTLLIER